MTSRGSGDQEAASTPVGVSEPASASERDRLVWRTAMTVAAATCRVATEDAEVRTHLSPGQLAFAEEVLSGVGDGFLDYAATPPDDFAGTLARSEQALVSATGAERDSAEPPQ